MDGLGVLRLFVLESKKGDDEEEKLWLKSIILKGFYTEKLFNFPKRHLKWLADINLIN